MLLVDVFLKKLSLLSLFKPSATFDHKSQLIVKSGDAQLRNCGFDETKGDIIFICSSAPTLFDNLPVLVQSLLSATLRLTFNISGGKDSL